MYLMSECDCKIAILTLLIYVKYFLYQMLSIIVLYPSRLICFRNSTFVNDIFYLYLYKDICEISKLYTSILYYIKGFLFIK